MATVSNVTGDGMPELAAGIRYDDTARGTDTGSVLLSDGATRATVCRMTDPNGTGSDDRGIGDAYETS